LQLRGEALMWWAHFKGQPCQRRQAPVYHWPMLYSNYVTIFVMLVHLHFRSWYETLVAWSLGAYVLLLVCYALWTR
jgi:hypothetical protein